MVRWAMALLLLCCVLGAVAQPGLQISISKRIPCQTDTVEIAAHLDGWEAPPRDMALVFSAVLDGREEPIGKARPATDPSKPFQPSVEWQPESDGMYRVIARDEKSGLEARLLVPVVVQDVYFCFYGATRPEIPWMTHHLTAGESEIDALHARGVMALKHRIGVGYIGGPRPEDVDENIDFEKLAVRVVRDYTQVDPWDGIAIDELGMWDQHPQHERLSIGFWEILKQARAAAPDKFFATWQFAGLTALECNMYRDTMDLVMCEVYQNFFRAWYDQHQFYEFLQQRIDVARTMMILKKTVIGLAISTDYGFVTPEELEDQIRYIRANGPEMRGLAFYTTSRCTPEVLAAANDCCFRYWVKPAVGLFSEADITFSDYQPEHTGIVRINATVHNVGGMAAKNVRVRFWDGDPANGGTQIGEEQVIDALPAARWVDPEARNEASWDPPEAIRRDGFGMVTVSMDWQPTRGPHEIWAEIMPDAQYTTIRGFESKRIGVR